MGNSDSSRPPNASPADGVPLDLLAGPCRVSQFILTNLFIMVIVETFEVGGNYEYLKSAGYV